MKYCAALLLIINTMYSFGQNNDSLKQHLFKVMMKKMHDDNLDKYVGDHLPSFLLPDINGIRVNSETLKGKPTVINFWFTNCTPCIEEIPMLNEIKNQYGNNVNFIAITFEKSKEIKRFLKLNTFDFIHLTDATEYLDQFGTFFGYPKTMILDKDFKVVKIQKNILPKHPNKIEARAAFRDEIITLLGTLL